MSKKNKQSAQVHSEFEFGWEKDSSNLGIRLELKTSIEDHFTKQIQEVVRFWNQTESRFRKKKRVILDSKVVPNYSDEIATALNFCVDLSNETTDPKNRISKLQEITEAFVDRITHVQHKTRGVKESCDLLVSLVKGINALAQNQHHDQSYLVVTRIVIFNDD